MFNSCPIASKTIEFQPTFYDQTTGLNVMGYMACIIDEGCRKNFFSRKTYNERQLGRNISRAEDSVVDAIK
jgi:hypothetical protein